MVNGYVRGQSDLRALSLLEELKYVLLQQDHQIAKQAVEIERLNRENEQLRGEITRLKDDPWYEDEEIMKSAPNSPESERKMNGDDERPNSEMKSDKSEDDEEPTELVPKMIFRLNKEKELEKARGSNSDLSEVINPQNIKEAKENIAKSIYHATNNPTTFIPQSNEMQQTKLKYDPSLVRQNPQGPPIHVDLEKEPKTLHPGEMRRGRSESLPNTYNENDQAAANYHLSQTTAYQRRAERQSLSRSSCSTDLTQPYGPFVEQQPVYDASYGQNYCYGNDQYPNGNNTDQQNLRPVDMTMYHSNWPGQMGQGVNDQSNYSQALTPNSTTSSSLDQSGDQPRARKLNENCRCQFCGKCFQSSWHLKRHERIHTNERPYNCGNCGKSFSDNSNYCKHVRKCYNGFNGATDCEIMALPDQ